MRAGTYLAIFQLEDQLDLVSSNLLVGQLGGDPALGGVWLPCPGADIIDVCHSGGGVVVRGVVSTGVVQKPPLTLSIVLLLVSSRSAAVKVLAACLENERRIVWLVVESGERNSSAARSAASVRCRLCSPRATPTLPRSLTASPPPAIRCKHEPAARQPANHYGLSQPHAPSPRTCIPSP